MARNVNYDTQVSKLAGDRYIVWTRTTTYPNK